MMDAHRPCPACSGRGYRSEPADGWEPPDERECSRCEGTGIAPCDVCAIAGCTTHSTTDATDYGALTIDGFKGLLDGLQAESTGPHTAPLIMSVSEYIRLRHRCLVRTPDPEIEPRPGTLPHLAVTRGTPECEVCGAYESHRIHSTGGAR